MPAERRDRFNGHGGRGLRLRGAGRRKDGEQRREKSTGSHAAPREALPISVRSMWVGTAERTPGL